MWREAPPVRVQKTFKPVSFKQVSRGSWSFDLGQNFAGIPKLSIKGVPAGTVIKVVPGESASGNGAVSPASSGSPTGIFNTYTTAVTRRRDVRADLDVPRLPVRADQRAAGRGTPLTEDTITGLATNADVPTGGTVDDQQRR